MCVFKDMTDVGEVGSVATAGISRPNGRAEWSHKLTTLERSAQWAVLRVAWWAECPEVLLSSTFSSTSGRAKLAWLAKYRNRRRTQAQMHVDDCLGDVFALILLPAGDSRWLIDAADIKSLSWALLLAPPQLRTIPASLQGPAPNGPNGPNGPNIVPLVTGQASRPLSHVSMYMPNLNCCLGSILHWFAAVGNLASILLLTHVLIGRWLLCCCLSSPLYVSS